MLFARIDRVFKPLVPSPKLLVHGFPKTTASLRLLYKTMSCWEEAPYDVLELITSFLTLPDFHRFASVCRWWQNVAKGKRHSPAPQLPWLVLADDPTTRKRKLFNMSEQKHYLLDLPELYGRYCCGSSHGWLFTIDTKLEIHLMNPFSRTRYQLPHPFSRTRYQLPRMPPLEGDIDESELVYEESLQDYPDDEENKPCTFEHRRNMLVFKAILSADPSKSSDFIVMTICGGLHRLAFWRPGDQTWTVLENVVGRYEDVIWYNRGFYAVSASNQLMAVDVGPNPKVRQIEPWVTVGLSWATRYLVDFMGELLLVLRWQMMDEKEHFSTGKFRVFKLDLENGDWCEWIHIDDYALFLGRNCAMVVPPEVFPNCEEDGIYFTDDIVEGLPKVEYGYDDLGVYNLYDKSIQRYYPPEVYHPATSLPIWLEPNPW